MPPKPAATATRQSGRAFPNSAAKPIPNSSSTAVVNSSPPSSATTAAIVPPPSAASHEFRSLHTSNSKNTLQKLPNATNPAPQAQPLNSRKTLACNSGLVKPDMANIDVNGNEIEVSGKSIECQRSGIEQFGPEKIIQVETASLSFVPAVRSHVQDEGSVKPVTGPESGADCVAGPRSGKRKIVRKVVRVVRKIIKKRVPKKVLRHDSEGQGSMAKAEGSMHLSEVTNNSNIGNDGIEKSNFVDEVTEKSGGVNVAKEILNRADDIIETSNLVNDDVIEQSNLVNGVMENSGIIDVVKEEENFTGDKLGLVNGAGGLESVIGKKGEDASGIDSMETDISTLNFVASSPEQLVPANDQSGVNNIKNNDVTTCVPDSMEVEKVNYIAENVAATETADGVMENQANDSVVENRNLYIDNKEDVGLVGGKSVVNESTFEKSESENDCIMLNEEMMMTGKMGALERKKRRKTEIFVGGLDNNTKEDEIRKVFEEIGVVVEVRLVMSANTGKNRGYAFVRFATAYDAKNALEKYSKIEICGKECNVALVGGNDTLFLGNIDRNWKTEDVVTLLEKASIEKIDKVTLKADPNNVEKNRGFAFLEFETGKDAETAFNKLQEEDAFGKNLMVKVEWAHPLIEPDEEEILKVKSVYAEYLPSSWDEEKVKEYFKRFGEVEDVVLAKDLPSSRRKDFAFIRYTNRADALTCIEVVTRGTSEDDRSKVKIAVSLANTNPKSKPVKRTPDLTSKQLPKAKPKPIRYFEKLHEPRHKGKPASSSSSYDDVKVDNKSSTTQELVQILRQQASSKHISPHPLPRTGNNAPDLHVPFPGSKRPFSLVGYGPRYVQPQGLPRAPVESSYPIPGPSSSYRGVDVLSFPYHPQQRPGFTSESVIGRINYPSHFQEREKAPYLRDNNIYHRY